MLSKNQIKEVQALHLKKQRDLRQRFIAEGAKTVLEIINERSDIVHQLFSTPNFITQHAKLLSAIAADIIELTEDELMKISLQNTPNQVLAVCKYFTATQPASVPEFALYLDDIRDPGNFGTIVRLCDWFGYTQLYCSAASCELYNPKVIQSSMGAFLRVNVTYCDIQSLKPSFNNIYGAVLAADDIYEEKLKGGLLIIGNEANGISENTMKAVTKSLTIPAANIKGSESLNAAMAASIMSAEFFRQLRKKN